MANLINITVVDDEDFICSRDWTVDIALEEIRSSYLFAGGRLVGADGATLRQTDCLSTAVGHISYRGGKPVQGGAK